MPARWKEKQNEYIHAPSLLLYYPETKAILEPCMSSFCSRYRSKILHFVRGNTHQKSGWCEYLELTCSEVREGDSWGVWAGMSLSVPSPGHCSHCWNPATCTHPVYLDWVSRLRLFQIWIYHSSKQQSVHRGACRQNGCTAGPGISLPRKIGRHACYACTCSQFQPLILNLNFSQGMYVCTYTSHLCCSVQWYQHYHHGHSQNWSIILSHMMSMQIKHMLPMWQENKFSRGNCQLFELGEEKYYLNTFLGLFSRG